ncbi:MAG: hypothetical protein KBD50_02305 [Candidatus Pacebacteria bacterium]|nr:hypothetical protein [Candidatus Paceibacterota bacterium]
MDLFLAQLFGIYFIIVGVAVLIRKKSLMPTVRELTANRPVLFTIALLEIAAGLAIVLSRPALTWDWMGIITLVGWMLLVEGVLYLVLPSKKAQQLTKKFTSPSMTIAGGILAVVAGGYLVYVGFGLGMM